MSDEEGDYEEIPNEEKLQIAQHFLLSSPPGQFHEVLTDVRKLLPDDLLGDPLAAGMARAFNTKTCKVIDSPSGTKVVINAASEVNPTHYFDSKSGNIFALDHLTLKTTEDTTTESNQDMSKEEERVALQSKLDEYMTGKFLPENSAAGVFTQGGNLVVTVSGERPNLRNFWSGKWTSNWNVALAPGQATVSGSIKVHAHYFEDGNVQLQTTKDIAAVVLPYTDVSELATQVVAHIESSETDLQKGLEEMYGNMNEETFRAMRRIMPVKRTKMEWNVNAVRMNKQVRK
mmetsp:Transcript_18657/g.31083  ORF Transcript_18657/g.31083 Transcript_18657/m.31083 type:complete len:288 (+) Transcript_18657:52-915(+)|eukprot:CAMPEP_0114466670 /NCGR_PEP_ID=MMETSP0104-20121206/9199_1 /TAXON_ID=37642 ORGANISM="Paraphysomonas imperforata, Strain PA2" /NCGR_SAMPLE_ID=MMETSP0104 /ASSEMBLY_ACC=CAM_ASM_000202 /LENGTH=287 /DNA_ID=CAMNT_0001640057 /DNA_START=27 /DNA_END=890 /DNA_ORIENTATION=-